MRYLGIDPGKAGALCLLGQFGEIHSLHPMPLVAGGKGARDLYDVVGMRNLVTQIASTDTTVVVEKLQPLPKSMGGGIANFERGRGLSLWEGILVGINFPYVLVPPQTWQRKILQGTDAKDTKQAAYVVASRIWPKQEWRRTCRCTKPDEGFVDAALIGRWGWMQHQGGMAGSS